MQISAKLGKRQTVPGFRGSIPRLAFNQKINFKGKSPERGTIMNSIVKKAYKINDRAEYWDINIPDLEIGDVVELREVWDCEEPWTEHDWTEYPCGSYSYIVSHAGEDGNENIDIYINYIFDILQVDDDELSNLVKIVDIELI